MVSDLNLIQRLEEMRVNGRDIYEVANQLGGYVGPDTERRLADFLIREAKAASDLADEIVRLTAALAEARDKALEEAAFVLECKAAYFSALPWQSGRHKEVQQRYRDDAAAIRALKEKP
jgi:hypothetical protein